MSVLWLPPRPRLPLRFHFLVMVGGLLAMLACGPAAQTPASATNEPKPGGTFTTRVTQDPYGWDMSVARSTPNNHGAALAYSRLLTYKAGPEVGYADNFLLPDLAERWEVSPDAKTFTFNLRKGVKLAANPNIDGISGRELTSADVKWSYEFYSRSGEHKELPPAEFLWMFTGLDRVDTPDPYTVVARFKEPFVPFVNFAGAGWNSIVPRDLNAKKGGLKDNILGTGPFQLDTSATQKGTRWVWKKNPDYFVPGRPYINEIRWLVLPDDNTAVAAFQTKQLDILPGLTIHQAEQLRKSTPDAVLQELEAPYPWTVHMNQTKPPLNDQRIRKAIALSVDRDEFIKTLQGGRGIWQMPAVYNGYFTNEEMRKLQPKDTEQAQRLVREAGFPNGIEVEVMASREAGDENIRILELLQAQVKKGGVNMVLKPIDRQTFSSNIRSKNFSYAYHSGASQVWDVDNALSYFHPASRNNYSGTNDPELTKLLDAQRAEPDPEKRRELVRQASTRIVEQAHSFGSYSAIDYDAWHPHVKNYGTNWNHNGPTAVLHSWLDK